MPSTGTLVAVCPGMFDPITLGHLDVIRRGREIFDRLVVGVGINPEKPALFSPDERVEMIRRVVRPLSRVEVQAFKGLAVDFARHKGARVMLRGIRSLSDMEYEFTMSLTNQAMAPDVETVFLMAREEYSYLSSTLIKQIALLGSQEQLRKFVPESVVEPLLAKLRKKRQKT